MGVLREGEGAEDVKSESLLSKETKAFEKTKSCACVKMKTSIIFRLKRWLLFHCQMSSSCS